MKMVGRTLLVLLLAAALGACSGSGNNTKDPDGSVPGQEGGSPDGTTTNGQVGDPCTQNGDCQSSICYEQTCRKACSALTDCTGGDECTSDDAKRTFCNTPTYKADVGKACAISGSCPDSTMKCIGGADWAGAYCTAECKTDADCPAEYFCRELSDEKTYCYKREFCGHCFHDGQCGAGNICALNNGESFCTYECTPGKTDCPRFAECKSVGGKNVCVHQAGTCVGDGKLCTPCITKNDCQDKALCLTFTYTQESFCSQECGGGTCPTSYDCVDISTSATESVKQCAPHTDTTSQELPKCVTKLNPLAEVGAKMKDFAMVGYVDSNNDGSLIGEKLRVVKLSDYKGRAKVILFNVSAGWCGPCQQETKTFEYLMKTYGPSGLVIFQVLFDTDKQGERPTAAFLDIWVNALKPMGASGIDPVRDSVVFNTEGTTPLNMIVDANTLEVLDKFNAFSLASTEAKLKTHLGL